MHNFDYKYSPDASWSDIMTFAVTLRKHLHKNPELSWQEHKTTATIRSLLDQAGITWRACTNTGTIATIAGNEAGTHVALRGDIDALPIDEKSGVDWACEEESHMHACGHDGHTATLMATALWLKKHEQTLQGPVSFVFQPAEEGGHGAHEMIKNGVLEGIDAIYGWHNWPAIPFGKAVCPDGAVMSANGTFEIYISGTGGHASQPEACADPVLAAAAMTQSLQQIVSRRLPPQTSAVVSVTSIDARSSLTVTPEDARVSGSVRVPDIKTRDKVFTFISEIATDTAKAYGVTADMTPAPRYGATINTPDEAATMRSALCKEFGDTWQDTNTPIPIMASEDFSYYLQEIPGAFALIGASDGAEMHKVACHSPYYDFNDALIPRVVGVFARLTGAPLPTAS